MEVMLWLLGSAYVYGVISLMLLLVLHAMIESALASFSLTQQNSCKMSICDNVTAFPKCPT